MGAEPPDLGGGYGVGGNPVICRAEPRDEGKKALSFQRLCFIMVDGLENEI